MIKKPAGYDEAAAYTGEFQQLPKGKYVCVIKQVTTQESKNGNQQFVILYDICKGRVQGLLQEDVRRRQGPESDGRKMARRIQTEHGGQGAFLVQGHHHFD